MERRITFDTFDLDIRIYSDKDFVENYKDFRTLAKGGFLGYQGQIEISKMSDRCLFSYFIYIYLCKSFSFMKETGWSDSDFDVTIIDNFVKSLIKKGLKSIFDDEVLKYYFATAKVEKLKSLIEEFNLEEKAKENKKNKRIEEVLEYIQYGLWERGILESKKLFKQLYFRNLLTNHTNPYINHPKKIDKYVASKLLPYIRSKEFIEKFEII